MIKTSCDGPQRFFVLSTGRSGSQTISRTLDQYRGCECAHEPRPRLTPEATDHFYGLTTDEDIERLLGERIWKPAKRLRGESNQQLSLIVPLLDRLYADSKFVWLNRDGRDVVASTFYRGWFDPEAADIPPLWKASRLRGQLHDEFGEDAWRELSRFEKCCWNWRAWNEIIESALAKLPTERQMTIKCETLKSSLPELVRFLGLKARRRVWVEVHNAARQPVSAWSAWSRTRQFESLCASAMDRWYPDWRLADGTWREVDRDPPDTPDALTMAQPAVINGYESTRHFGGNIARKLGLLPPRKTSKPMRP